MRDKAMVDDHAAWNSEPTQRPEMQVAAPDHFAHPIGFIDFRFKHMKAENGRNASERRCQIRTVRLK
jgi:hypothetical protein